MAATRPLRERMCQTCPMQPWALSVLVDEKRRNETAKVLAMFDRWQLGTEVDYTQMLNSRESLKRRHGLFESRYYKLMTQRSP